MRRFLAGLAATTMLVLVPVAPAIAGNKGDGNFCPGRDNTCNSGGGGGGGGGGHNGGGGKNVCSNRADGQYLINGQIVVCLGGVVVDIL